MIKAALKEILEKQLGINISSILLPKKNVDMQRWAVVACDQYTSEPEYWKEANEFVGEKPSTLGLIYPEAYLEHENDAQKAARIDHINENMRQYLESDLFDELKDTLVLVERTFENGSTRHGLVFAVDLEKYDYTKGSQSMIRATEGTIVDRLPPRIRVREHAVLELPHIMLLIDDKNKTVIEPLVQKANTFSEVYSFELMKKSGHIKGWKVTDEKEIESMAQSLLKLSNTDQFKERYGVDDAYDVLLFAVGDGNHSLATAKACWESIKKTLSPQELSEHPARYALVEVVNVHDKGLIFEPIHRVLFNVDHKHLAEAFCSYYAKKGCSARIVYGSERPHAAGHIIQFTASEGSGFLVVEHPVYNLDVATLQSFLDDYLKVNTKVTIDYVHGTDVTERLGNQPGNMGFFLSPMDKNELFRTVILDGALPRKTFSMGEASEKRFYLEARKIRHDRKMA